jgi:predicted PurR-regulated permease PerM
VLIGIALVVLGVPLAATLTALTFFGGFVPIVGAFVAGAVAVLVALVTEGTTTALLLLGIVILVQQLEGNVLSPWLQGRSLQLHAGIVLLAVTGGGTRYGLIGAFLAVPVAACVVVLLRYLSEQVDVAAASPPPVEDRDPETPPGEPGIAL